MKMEIKIVFQGEQGSGKTSVLNEVKDFLLEEVGLDTTTDPTNEHALIVNTEPVLEWHKP